MVIIDHMLDKQATNLAISGVVSDVRGLMAIYKRQSGSQAAPFTETEETVLKLMLEGYDEAAIARLSACQGSRWQPSHPPPAKSWDWSSKVA